LHRPVWLGEPEGAGLCSKGQIAFVKPKLVIVDPLRTFHLEAELKSDNAAGVIKFHRRISNTHDCSWMTLHHKRKANANALYPTDLADDPNGWLQDTAGSLALINHMDLRLGIDTTRKGQADLVVNGFRRFEGVLGATYLVRERDEAGEPAGYRLATGTENLSQKFQEIYNNLADSFRYKDVTAAMGGNSGSNVAAFLNACQNGGTIVNDSDRGKGHYRKTQLTRN
jgi:hypothetical protein